ncbi:MAG: hypothetical protein MJZ93_03155 [Paludibacteraceae bacterium]|nr:hypothetical protein [Paludibacteraceae bacterium]
MKKTFFIGLVFVAAMLSSCTKTYVDDNAITRWKIVDVDVPARSWQEFKDEEGLNLFYVATVDVPELTDVICKDGMVSCYLVDGDVQIVLPYIRHYQDAEGFFWTTTNDYEFSVGKLDLYITNSDFADDPPVGNRRYRLVLVW